MDHGKFLELQRLSVESAAMSALLILYRKGEMPFEDWAHYAIVTLAKQNVEYHNLLVDNAMMTPHTMMQVHK